MEKRTTPTPQPAPAARPVISFYADVPNHASLSLLTERLTQFLTNRGADPTLLTQSGTLSKKTRVCHSGVVAQVGETLNMLTEEIKDLAKGVEGCEMAVAPIGSRETTQEAWDKSVRNTREAYKAAVAEFRGQVKNGDAIHPMDLNR